MTGTVKKLWSDLRFPFDRWAPEVLMAMGLAFAGTLASLLNHDTAWYLLAARRLLHGDRLYVDFFDVNPPLYLWLFTLPAVAGQELGLPDAVVASGFTVLLLLFSVTVAVSILNLAPIPSRALRSGIICGFLVVLVIVSVRDIAQRDQVAAMLLFPYVVASARTAARLSTPRSLAVTSAVVAGFGVALKPFFLAPWVAIELFIILARRELWAPLFRAEVWIVALVQCAYFTSVAVLAPEYLTHVVPLAKATYGAYGVDRMLILQSGPVLGLLVCGLGALLIPLAVRTPARQPLAGVLGAATLGFLVSYVAQGKGWSYHQIPAIVFGALSLIACGERLATDARRTRPLRRLGRGRLALLAVVLLGATAWGLPGAARFLSRVADVVPGRYHPVALALADVVAQAPGEPVYFISTSVWPAFPVVNLGGASWPYHFNALWPLAGFYAAQTDRTRRYRAPGAQGPLEAEFFRTIVQDLSTTPPRFLIVDRGRKHQALENFDLLEYFSASAEFTALFRRYRRVRVIARWEVYERGP